MTDWEDKSAEAVEDLESLRAEIDGIDDEIGRLVARRQTVVNRVAEIKRKHHLPVYHPAREEDLISSRRARGAEAGLNPDFIEELYRVILRQSRFEQSRREILVFFRDGEP
ncbi:MAG: chorismate mutase, partial [Thermodesulfobacteriota bacterium]